MNVKFNRNVSPDIPHTLPLAVLSHTPVALKPRFSTNTPVASLSPQPKAPSPFLI
jgi:hypothetical protein